MSKNILKNKNCLITGATGGIGVEISKILNNESCNLFLTSTNKQKLQKLYSSLDKSKNKIFYQDANLTNNNEMKLLITNVRKKLSNIDIIIHCAGKFLIKPFLKNSVKDFDLINSINVRVPFILSKEFAKDMIKNSWGRIVFLGSSSSYGGFPNGTIYTSSKHSILGLSRALNSELKNSNVRTLCISPASTKTEMAKLSIDQDFSTFLSPIDVANYIVFVMKYDNEMVVDESRLNRMVMK